MDNKVLVTFVTTHGATQEIAEFIAGVLREQGLAVDVMPMRQAKSLDGYGAVVMGAPMYMFQLPGDVHHFLARHRAAISGGLPVAFFSGGPIEPGKPEQFNEVRAQFDKLLAKIPWFQPAAVKIVGGRFDPNNLRFPWKLIPAMKMAPAADLRDWDDIRAWAASLTALLAAGQTQAA